MVNTAQHPHVSTGAQRRQRRGLLAASLLFLALLLGAALPAAPLLAAGPDLKNWPAVLQQAQGQNVQWYAWGGSTEINDYIAWAAAQVKQRYGVTVTHVKVSDTANVVNKVVSEVQAGRRMGGSVDLIWINGENFRTLKAQDLIFGPVLPHLPNSKYIEVDSSLFQADFGYPTEGYEAPWGHAQFVFIYDTARVAAPPRDFAALTAWLRANPGKFTYPAPPDYVGTTFLKHLLYAFDGGPGPYQQPYDDATYKARVDGMWDWLRENKPYFWRKGETYPETQAQLDTLFANGEVHFAMAFNPSKASNLIANGQYPQTTRTFILDGGTIANTHFVAIPANAANQAGAAVLADFLMSPEAQLRKGDPDLWGDPTVLSMDKLPADWRARFQAQPRGVATLSPAELSAKQPEPPAGWGVALEKDWRGQVFGGR